MTRFLPTSRGPVARTGSIIAPAIAALGIALAGAGAASAGTVDLQDPSGALDATSVQADAATLPVSVSIWTTTLNSTKSAFDESVRGRAARVSDQFPVTVGVDTALRHSSVQLGPIAGLTPAAATSAETAATAAFDASIHSTKSYTSAVIALLDSVKTSLAALPAATPTTTAAPTTTATPTATATTTAATASTPVPTSDATTTAPSSNGPGTTVIVVGIVVAVLMVVVLADVFRRGRRTDPKQDGPRPVSPREPVGQGARGYGRADEPGAGE